MLTPEIITKLVERCYPPTGIWADFDHDYKWYYFLTTLVPQGKLRIEDLPPEPQPSDYPDLTSPKTRE